MTDPNGDAFVLDVETDPAAGIARLRLTAGRGGGLLGARQVVRAEHRDALWQGLFATRDYLRTYGGVLGTAEEILAQIGRFLGEVVLGPEIAGVLWEGIHHRSLVVRLHPSREDDALAAAFARVPWEIARPAAGAETLLARNLVVRMETPGPAAANTAPLPDLQPGESLRVLLVCAEAPGSRPLAMRLERERLLDLFYDRVMPHRNVRLDVLCHGVTRRMLREAVKNAGGFHVVHWSGHGHANLLELMWEDGGHDRFSGEELVQLFQKAGGFLPRLVFLSACHSGTLIRDRATLKAVLQGGGAPGPAPMPAPGDPLVAARPGYTGTALALLRSGVPQVVAMRYEVGDAYARDLAERFYAQLFQQDAPKSPASALALARSELLEEADPQHAAIDHATPLLFGRDAEALPAAAARSPFLDARVPRPQPLLPGSAELDRSARLVGRGAELRALHVCLEIGRPAVAVVQGLAGLGKTALAAEAIHLWHRGFKHVLAFQAKPDPLKLEDFYRQVDLRLALDSVAYRTTCERNAFLAIHLAEGPRLQGEARWTKMRENLREALRNEPILLVLDNFEPQLETVARGKEGFACQDPQWDRLLVHLAEGLQGTGSRLLVTTRHRLMALARKDRAVWVPLGPLPGEEAVLFLQETEALQRLAFGADRDVDLAMELLDVSGGHPLLLTRLGALARDRAALAAVLQELRERGLGRLPDVFAQYLSEEERKEQLEYLEDIAGGAVDLLLRRASSEARWLLWRVTVATEAVPKWLIDLIWKEATPVLAELRDAGLLTLEAGESYGFHELVRERVDAWMEAHPDELGGVKKEQVWLAYGERYKEAFYAMRAGGVEGSMDQALEVGRRGISYLVRAREFDRLIGFADAVVTSTRDPRVLRRLNAELERVVGDVPAGRARWSLQTNLADSLRQSGRVTEAFPFYEQAVTAAEEAEDWSDVGWICQNWALALCDAGRLDAAKATYVRSATATARAGEPRVHVLGSELEAFRIDVMQGEAQRTLPEIESRLQELRAWWRRHLAGESVPEAPHSTQLARSLVGGLDIARQASVALERWEACLSLLTENEEVKLARREAELEVSRTRFNRYGPLLRLGRLEEAEEVLEGCLGVSRRADDLPFEARTLSALADLWASKGDLGQAAGLERKALATCNRLPDLESRAISHGNLASYFQRLGAGDEARGHRLAGVVYNLLTGHGEGLKRDLRNLAIDIRRAAVAGERFEPPRLTDLLANPEFEALQRTLTEWGVAIPALQTAVDELVAEVRRAVE